MKRKAAEGKTKGVENTTTSKKARISVPIKPVCGKKSKQSNATNLKTKKSASNLSKLKSSLKKTKRLSRIKTKSNHVSFNESIEIKKSSDVKQINVTEESTTCAKNESKKPATTIKIETKRKAAKEITSFNTSATAPSVIENKNKTKKGDAISKNENKLKKAAAVCKSKNKTKKEAFVSKNENKTKKAAAVSKNKIKTKKEAAVSKNDNKTKKGAAKSVDESLTINSTSAVSTSISIPRNTATLNGAIAQNDLANSNLKRLTFQNYDKPCTELAKYLLGKLLVYQTDNGCRVSGRIVETEAYLGGEDKASHSYNGKKTDRIAAMYMPPGTSYVYNIYGVYACVNVSSKGDGAAVLIRSLEPVEGVAMMKAARRSAKNKEVNADKLKEHQLCNGPSKLTQALGITKANGDQVDLNTCKYLWIEDGENVDDSKVVACSRIGIGNYAQDWTDKPLRFYVKNNKCVSVRDKKAES